MSSDPPPPYPGGPNAPLLEEKNGQPPVSVASAPVMTGPPQGQPLPPEYGPPPYEATLQPGFVPPHVPGEGMMPKPVAMPMPMPHPHGGYYPPLGIILIRWGSTMDQGPVILLGSFSHSSGPSWCGYHRDCPAGGNVPVSSSANCVSTLPAAHHHCISHDIGLMNTLFCLFCFVVGCDLGCCLIPCLIDDLKDVTHTCPNCKGYIYTYKRIC